MANLRKSVLLLCFTLLSHVARVHSVDCDQIGTGYYQDSTGQWVRQLWPYTAGQGFDIIPASACYIRFQNPGTFPNTPISRATFWAAIEACRFHRLERPCIPNHLASANFFGIL